MSWKRLWWIALGIKLVLGSVIPLSNDEAYYWVWGQVPQLSYYDHPPFVAWLFFVARPLEWLRDIFPVLEGVVRWPAILLGHGTLLVLFRVIGPSISERQRMLVIGLLLLSPFFGVGSLIVTPDIPYVFFWCLGILAFKLILERPSLRSSALLGTALGLGFCSKYLIVIFVPIALLYIFANRRWDILRGPYLFAAITAGLLFSSPVIFWNAQNDWVSFRFQLGHGLDIEALTLERKIQQLLEYIGAQAALLGPLIFVTGFGRTLSSENRILIWMGWGPILFFIWTSLRSPVEANWPIAGHLTLLSAAAIISGRLSSKAWTAKIMMTVWLLATAAVLFQTTRPHESLFGIEAHRLKTYEFVRYKALEQKVLTRDRSVPLYASSYQMAGALSFAAHHVVPKLAGINRVDIFDLPPYGPPSSVEFEVVLEHDWPWPSWIAERSYVEVSREYIDRFTIVRFQRKH